MLYLALHTLLLLAVTAGIFFAFGYFFHQRFIRARVVVSEQPPAHPPSHTMEASDQMIQDLRSRLIEKERDLALLLESVPQETSASSSEAQLADLQTAYNEAVLRGEEIERQWHADSILKTAEIEALKLELERLQADVTKATSISFNADKLDESEWQAKLEKAQARIDSLETQLNERDYLLQLSQQKQESEIRELESAAEEIWGEEEITFEATPESMPVAAVPSEVNLQLVQIQTRSENMEKEFRDRLRTLEASLENLRSENEMALLAALEVSKAQQAVVAPAPSADPKRDRVVEALWKEEKDAERERLERSVEMLRRELQAKEQAIGELGEQVEDLSHKIDPTLQGADDLELIKGIGPYTRKMLKSEFAIDTFEQVARLTTKDVERISERLFFHGKIEKEDWIGQALALYNKKYAKPIELTDPPYPLKWKD